MTGVIINFQCFAGVPVNILQVHEKCMQCTETCATRNYNLFNLHTSDDFVKLTDQYVSYYF